jgi:hypothetical protein
MDEFAPPSADERARAREQLVLWLDSLSDNPVVDAVVEDEESEQERWFVRVNGEAKDVYSVWFELGQRTLAYETYVMPSPDENHAEFFEQLLRRNDDLRDLAFTVGEERAIFLKGRLDLQWIDDQSLDRILGSVYAAVERCFQSAVRVGFASRFATPS